jgi:hypothetical protein
MFLVQLYETTMSKTKELAADLLKNVDVVKGLVKQQVQTVMDKMVYLRWETDVHGQDGLPQVRAGRYGQDGLPQVRNWCSWARRSNLRWELVVMNKMVYFMRWQMVMDMMVFLRWEQMIMDKIVYRRWELMGMDKMV